jgi:hypothetical protein
MEILKIINQDKIKEVFQRIQINTNKLIQIIKSQNGEKKEKNLLKQ